MSKDAERAELMARTGATILSTAEVEGHLGLKAGSLSRMPDDQKPGYYRRDGLKGSGGFNWYRADWLATWKKREKGPVGNQGWPVAPNYGAADATRLNLWRSRELARIAAIPIDELEPTSMVMDRVFASRTQMELWIDRLAEAAGIASKLDPRFRRDAEDILNDTLHSEKLRAGERDRLKTR